MKAVLPPPFLLRSLAAGCGWYDPDTEQWLTDGTGVLSRYTPPDRDNVTLVTCNTTHLTDFAAFHPPLTLGAVDGDIFAITCVGPVLGMAWGVFVLFAVLSLLLDLRVLVPGPMCTRRYPWKQLGVPADDYAARTLPPEALWRFLMLLLSDHLWIGL